MTKEDMNIYLNEMYTLVKMSQDDPEVAHYRADNILCEVLIELGYDELVGIFNIIRKWYS